MLLLLHYYSTGARTIYTILSNNQLCPLLQRIFCTPAMSAPVERIFSQSRLMMPPHRASMSDLLFKAFVYLKSKVYVF